MRADFQSSQRIGGRQHQRGDAQAGHAVHPDWMQPDGGMGEEAAAEFKQRQMGEGQQQAAQSRQSGCRIVQPLPFDERQHAMQKAKGRQQPEVAGEAQHRVLSGQGIGHHPQNNEGQSVDLEDQAQMGLAPAVHAPRVLQSMAIDRDERQNRERVSKGLNSCADIEPGDFIAWRSSLKGLYGQHVTCRGRRGQDGIRPQHTGLGKRPGLC
ncbi:MAG: hypothetical protein ACYCY9_00755 [Thiobacillus sp.]